MKLDLGGTACYEDRNAVCISDDGSSSDDEVTPIVIADYNSAPFPNDSFEEALGSCYLEEKPNFEELYRILKPGARALIKSCDALYDTDERVKKDILGAGFKIIETSEYIQGYGYDAPWIIQK